MKKIIATALVVCCMLFCLGFMFGGISEPSCAQRSAERLKDFRDGKKTFCQVSELERFIICPLRRTYEVLYDGGTLVSYACDEERMYVEASNLTKKSEKLLNGELEVFKQRAAVVKHCEGKDYIIYKLTRKRYD